MTMLKEFQMLLWTKLSQTRESKTQENHPSPSFIFLISFSFCFHCHPVGSCESHLQFIGPNDREAQCGHAANANRR